MNDEHQPDPQLDPEQDAAIRALLADLGTAPDATSMPPEVAARLDETLARLVAERDGPASETANANVVPLRRRWAARTAAAAAAVIVVGAGGIAAANLGLFGGASSSESSTAGGAAKPESLDDSAESPTAPGAAPSQRSMDGALGDVPRLSAATFETDVARLLQDPPPGATSDFDSAKGQSSGGAPNRRETAEKGLTHDALPSRCPGPRTSDGATRIRVRYDGTLALLLAHPARAGAQGDRLIEVWTCRGDRRLARASLPGSGLASPSPAP